MSVPSLPPLSPSRSVTRAVPSLPPLSPTHGSSNNLNRIGSMTMGRTSSMTMGTSRTNTSRSNSPATQGLSICMAIDYGDVCRKAFEDMLVTFAPKNIIVLHCCLPDEKTPQNESNIYTEIARKLDIYSVRYGVVDVKQAADIPDVTVTYALRHKCDMICIATRFTEKKDGKVSYFGRTSDLIVRNSHIPVMVNRIGGAAQKKTFRYVVAVEDSKVSPFCLQFIRALAKPTDEIVVVSCQMHVKEAEEIIHKQIDASYSLNCPAFPFGTVPHQLDFARITTQAYKRNSDMNMAENLVSIAEELSADILVLSTAWKYRKFDLGSTISNSLYQPKLKCNVLVYKNPNELEVIETGRRTSESAPA